MSGRSYWGWGWEDHFPSRTERQQLGTTFANILGFEPTTLRDPLPIEALSLPDSRIEPPSHLANMITSAIPCRAAHTYGKGFPDIVRGLTGEFTCPPDLVAQPASEQDVIDLVGWCTHQRLALIPYGGGTSVVGGVEANVGDRFNGVVCCDLGRLSGVVEVSKLSRAARIGAGTLGPKINRQLADSDLELHHFPQSYEHSTLGGWLATRAGGQDATLYTRIDDLVESLRMVSPAGTFETRRVPAAGAGPYANRLLLGSEGAFGVITEAWVRLQKRPRWRATATLYLDELPRGVEAVRALSQSMVRPTSCHLLEAREAMLHGVASEGEAVLILGFESADRPTESLLERAVAIAQAEGGCRAASREVHDGTARNASTASYGTARNASTASWREIFFKAPYVRDVLISVGVIIDTFATACTWDRFAELDTAVREEVSAALRRVCGDGLLTCRITHIYPDGLAPTYTFLAPGRPGAEIIQHAEIKEVASQAVLKHGGTLAHHHAVGRVHLPYIAEERAPLVTDALVAVKRQLDPRGVMNPAALLPLWPE